MQNFKKLVVLKFPLLCFVVCVFPTLTEGPGRLREGTKYKSFPRDLEVLCVLHTRAPSHYAHAHTHTELSGGCVLRILLIFFCIAKQNESSLPVI